MKKTNRWFWAGMIIFLIALLSTGCSNEGGNDATDQDDNGVIEYELTLYYPEAIYVNYPATVVVVAEYENQPVDDGTDVHFYASDGSFSPNTAETRGGMATSQLTVPKTGDMVVAVTANKTIVHEIVSVITPEEDVSGLPATISLSHTWTSDDYPAAYIQAVVRDAANSPVTDGTLVYFQGCCGTFVPNPALTKDGLACTTYTPNDPADPKDDTITVTSGDLLSTITLSFLGDPKDAASITLTPSSATMAPGTSVVISAIVLDGENSPMPDGTVVYFDASFGSVSPIVASTHLGMATAIYAATNFYSVLPATAIITATVGDIQATVPVTVEETEAPMTP